MNICTVAKLIWCLVYYRNHKLCILMSLSILFDNYSHHIIDIHHLHGLLHCGFLNFVLMWLHIHTGNRNIFYLHWSLICGTWNQLYLWFFLSHWLHFFMGFQTSLRFDLLMTLTTGILSTLMDNVWMFWIIFIKTNMLQKKKPWLHTTTLWASSSHTRVSLESFSSTSVRPFPSQKVTMRTALRAYKFLLV